MYSNYLQPSITEPTRAPGKNTSALFDNIFGNTFDMITYYLQATSLTNCEIIYQTT